MKTCSTFFFLISVDFTRVTLRSFVMFPYPLLFSVHYTCTLNIDILTFFRQKVLYKFLPNLIESIMLSSYIYCCFLISSRASQVGRQLARIGDDINRRYADEFKDMINQLNVTEDTAYEVFAGVAKK